MDDLISRQAAIDKITEYGSGNVTYMSVVELKRRIEHLPSTQPETHEKRTETHACDCISRQAAIDAINELHDKPNAWLDLAVARLEELPSAQPEIANQTEESAQNVPNGELISKKAAIEALEKMSANYGKIGRREWHPHIEECKAELSMLPSAQPEIILCKDCDWWTKQEDSLQGRCARYGMYPTGYWYCASARERREG